MAWELLFTQQYMRRVERFIKKHPDLISQYEKTLRLLQLNPYHPSLRLHKLQGRLKEMYSISITISYRLTLTLLLHDKQIVLIDVGDHQQVY